MSVSSFKELKEHIGHEIVCVYYGTNKRTAKNVAIECETCCEVLMSFDKPMLDPDMWGKKGWKFICKQCKADGKREFTFDTIEDAFEHQEAQG